MVRANLRINGGDEYWFEALPEEIVGVARKTGAEVAEAIARWAYWTDSLSCLQLGNPYAGELCRYTFPSAKLKRPLPEHPCRFLIQKCRYCPENERQPCFTAAARAP